MSNIKLHYSVKTELTKNEQSYDMTAALQLLKQIQQHGNLRAAAKSCAFSYRKSWDILKQSSDLFGTPLVNTQQGKGSQVTTLGKILLNTAETSNQLINERLTTSAEHANALIQTTLSSIQSLNIIASDSEKLNQLREQHKNISLYFDGSQQALTAYDDGRCEIAGFHISAKKNTRQLSTYCQYLNKKDNFVLLEKRTQGIISHPKQPLHSLQEIIDRDLLFVNRQSGSGTRQLIDLLLQNENIKPDELKGYYHEEHTHLAIASMVSSGQANAGIGIESAAEELKLHFSPLNDEYYFLVFKNRSPLINQVLLQLFSQQSVQIMGYQSFIKFLS